jgi:hypothetical protein
LAGSVEIAIIQAITFFGKRSFSDVQYVMSSEAELRGMQIISCDIIN